MKHFNTTFPEWILWSLSRCKLTVHPLSEQAKIEALSHFLEVVSSWISLKHPLLQNLIGINHWVKSYYGEVDRHRARICKPHCGLSNGHVTVKGKKWNCRNVALPGGLAYARNNTSSSMQALNLLLSKVKGVNLNHFLIIKPCTSGSDELISLCMQHTRQMLCD